jgi:hypothetical protein
MRRTTGTILGVLAGVGLALWAANPIKAQPATTTVSVTAIAAGDNNIGNVDIASSALPTGASTETTLGSVLTSVQTIAVSGELIDNIVVVEDAVHGSGNSGVMALAVRNDAGTALAADGDYIPLSVDSSGAVRVTGGGGGTQYTEADTDATITGTAVLWEDAADTLRAVSTASPFPVSCGDCSGTGVSHVDDAAFNDETDDIVPIAAMFADAAPDSVTEDDAGVVRMSANRNLYVTIRDAAGNERGLNINAANELAVASHAVTNAGTFVVQENGAALTALQLLDNVVTTEDTASAGGGSGLVIMARQTATPANQAGTDGDFEYFQMSAGRLWTSTTVTGTVTIDSELPAASALADNTSNPTTPSVAAFIMCYDGSTWDRCTQGTTTEATQDAALTVATTIGLVGMARASATEPTNVTADDDAVMLWALRSGALAVTNRASDGDDMTDTTNDALRVNIVAGAAAGGTSITDDAAYTVATSSLTPVGGTYRSTRDPVTDGDAGAFAMTINRGLYTSPETPLGDSMADDTLDTLKVSQATAANLNATVVGTGTFAVQVSSLPASTNTIEVVGDAAHDATIAGNPLSIGGVSSAAAPTDVSADGEAVRLWALRNGALAIQPTFSGSLAAVNNGAVSGGVLRVTVANDSTGVLASVGTISTSVTAGTSAAHLGKAEDAAHGSADTGVAVLARRIDTLASSADTSGDYATFNLTSAGALWSAPSAATNGGCSPHSIISANTVNETAMKASAGQIYSLVVTNIGANEVFFKLYNDTTANIDETDTPVLRYTVPGNAAGAGFVVPIPVGIAFSTAITYRITGAIADNDTTAIAANEVLVSACYL